MSYLNSDEGFLERLEALADQWERAAKALPITNEQNYIRIGLATCVKSLRTVLATQDSRGAR